MSVKNHSFLRLNKHKSVHRTKKYCHYYNNDKECPFEELGCMFRHEVSKNCYFRGKCKNSLCQFTHSEKIVVNFMNDDRSDTILEFRCDQCGKNCMNKDLFKKHMDNHDLEKESI